MAASGGSWRGCNYLASRDDDELIEHRGCGTDNKHPFKFNLNNSNDS